ncbi:hypothetical protein WA158_006833 [Blastocystis sp. Blastoise]
MMYNQNDVEKQSAFDAYVANCNRETRLGFIKKVYGILSVQLLITFGLILLTTYVESLRVFFTQYYFIIFFASLAVSIAYSLGMMCCYSVLHKVPYNYIGLFVYTIIEACLLSSVCGMVESKIVLSAVLITFGVVIGLTIYAFVTKTDFTGFGPYLFAALLGLCLSGLFMFWFNNWMYTLYCAIAVIIFCLYLVYDTQLVIGGSHKYSFTIDDYVIAALNIYLDIINLFVYILSLLVNSRDN